jgi:hypothetical protein
VISTRPPPNPCQPLINNILQATRGQKHASNKRIKQKSKEKRSNNKPRSVHHSTPTTVGSRPVPNAIPAISEHLLPPNGPTKGMQFVERKSGRGRRREAPHRIRLRRRRCGGRRRRRIRRGPAPRRAGPPCRPSPAAAPRRERAPRPWAARMAAAASPSWGGPWAKEVREMSQKRQGKKDRGRGWPCQSAGDGNAPPQVVALLFARIV